MNPLSQLMTNSAIISLLIGFAIGIFKIFEIPSIINNLVSLYLIFTIGLKGGMCLGVTDTCTPPLVTLAIAGLLIAFMQPFINFFILKLSTTLDKQTAIVVASQYGSISIVTFLTAITFLNQNVVAYDTFMTAVAGMMEIPALFSGLLLIKGAHKGNHFFTSFVRILREIVLSKKISFIFIGFFAGFLLLHLEINTITDIILWPFNLILILFMVDVGIKISQQRAHIHHFSWPLIAFGIYMPIISGMLSILVSYFLGIQAGSALLFAVLVGSASYIAVPAIMQTQAPDAKEVIYLPLAMGVTLPFNILIGIQLFYFVASYVL